MCLELLNIWLIHPHKIHYFPNKLNSFTKTYLLTEFKTVWCRNKIVWSRYPLWTLVNFSQNLIDFLRFRCSLIGCTQNFLAFNLLLVFSLITEYRIKIKLICRFKKDRYQALISKSILQLFPLQLSFFKKILSIYIIANQFIV